MLTSTTSPEIGEFMSLLALTLSTAPKLLPPETDTPVSGRSTNTTSPRWSWDPDCKTPLLITFHLQFQTSTKYTDLCTHQVLRILEMLISIFSKQVEKYTVFPFMCQPIAGHPLKQQYKQVPTKQFKAYSTFYSQLNMKHWFRFNKKEFETMAREWEFEVGKSWFLC